MLRLMRRVTFIFAPQDLHRNNLARQLLTQFRSRRTSETNPDCEIIHEKPTSPFPVPTMTVEYEDGTTHKFDLTRVTYKRIVREIDFYRDIVQCRIAGLQFDETQDETLDEFGRHTSEDEEAERRLMEAEKAKKEQKGAAKAPKRK